MNWIDNIVKITSLKRIISITALDLLKEEIKKCIVTSGFCSSVKIN